MAIFCTECGTAVADGIIFCGKCGQKQVAPVSAQASSGSPGQSLAGVSQDSKNMGLLIWILSIFFGFIPSLIFYLTKKDDPYIQDQAKEALNWSITAAIGYIGGMILMVILIGFFVMMVVGIVNLVFCIMGAMAVSNGKNFRVPFAVRLIK